MVLPALEKILDISFKPDITIKNINLINIDSDKKLSKDGDSVNINVSELEPEEREEIIQLPRQEFEDNGRILQESEYEEAVAIEEGYDNSAEEIVEYFSDLITDEYLEVIEDSLYLRGLIQEKHFTKDQIQRRRSDIAEGRGENAMYISSLTTAGYFHPNGGIRDLLVTMRLNDQYDPYAFQKELDMIFSEKLLAIFVNNDDDVWEKTTEVKGRLSKYDDMNPINDWIEIRGIGPRCEEIIEGVVENLNNDIGSIEIDLYNDDMGQRVARIHPYSVASIS